MSLYLHKGTISPHSGYDVYYAAFILSWAISCLLSRKFRDHVENKYKVPAGFITKNVKNFREKVEKRDWRDYLVMASITKSGFFVNPDLDTAIKAIEKPGMNFIGMSTLSGGALKPEEAYEFLGKIKNIHSVVVGMSQRDHIRETVDSINKYIR